MGKPLSRAAQIVDSGAVDAALDALLHGGDEPKDRDTTARGWNKRHYGEGEDAMKMWYEELSDIDEVITESLSEAEEVKLTVLPTGSLVNQIEESAQRASTWYAAAIPVYHKRLVHIHYDELSEVAGDLRSGKINAAEAKARYDTIMADLGEIEGFSKFMMG
jgi:hypothetical protein